MIWDLGDQKSLGAKMDQNSGPFRGQEPLWLQGCREPMRSHGELENVGDIGLLSPTEIFYPLVI